VPRMPYLPLSRAAPSAPSPESTLSHPVELCEPVTKL
jgi:hypothetical protein